MNDLMVLLVLFTVVLFGLFQLAISYFTKFNAFLICSVVVVLATLGFVGLREGIIYNSNFASLNLNGYMRANPYGNNNATEFNFSNLRVDGNSNGTIY